jgi:ribonuclease P protein component
MLFTESIKANSDFRRIYGRGKSFAGHILVLYCRKNKLGKNRLGITVGTKVGNAVVRNRIKRRIREAYRSYENVVHNGLDIVVVARSKAVGAEYRELCDQLLTLLKKCGAC